MGLPKVHGQFPMEPYKQGSEKFETVEKHDLVRPKFSDERRVFCNDFLAEKVRKVLQHFSKLKFYLF